MVRFCSKSVELIADWIAMPEDIISQKPPFAEVDMPKGVLLDRILVSFGQK